MYTFSSSSETYTDLVGSTSIPFGNLQLDFPFVYFGIQYNQINIDGSSFILNENVGFPIFFTPLMVSGRDGAGTELFTPSKKTEGAIGTRITKIEFKNAKLRNNLVTDVSTNKVVNYQIWMHEGSNDLEFRYGFTDALRIDYTNCYDSEVYVYLMDGLSQLNSMSLYGNSASPSVDYYKATEALNDEYQPLEFQDDIIQNGTKYKFHPIVAGKKELNKNFNLSIYPNPASEYFTIESKEFSLGNIKIFDASGTLIFEKIEGQNSLQIDSKNWSDGVYLIEMETEKGIFHQKIIKE